MAFCCTRKKWVILAIFLLAGLFICLLHPVNIIVIRADTGETVQHKAGKDARITFYFLHSYYRVPQYECFFISNNHLVLDEVRFGDLQAATYWNPDIQYLYDENTGFYYLKNIGYKMNKHIFSLAHHTEYSIFVDKYTYDLNETFPEAHTITTTITIKPWIFFISGVVFGGLYEYLR